MVADYLLRFAQAHETFRQPEIEALAELHRISFKWLSYDDDIFLNETSSILHLQTGLLLHCALSYRPQSPFSVIQLESADETAIKTLVSRSILCLSAYELWGEGSTYESLHNDVRYRASSIWPNYETCSFRFEVDTFRVSKSTAAQKAIIDSFAYLPLQGPIRMKNPDQAFAVFEEYRLRALQPHKLYFGRWLSDGGRRLLTKYDLKKRKYIATTSMDAELSLLTANIAMADNGKLAYDPFMGTGSFPVSCSAFGATAFGSDLDGRSIRGKGGRSVAANFTQYGTGAHYLGGCAADLTNTPLVARPYLDIIVCDPPYGVREGLKVLGHVKERLQTQVVLRDGTPAHLQQDYVPPKKPYSFVRMLDDILDFSADRLVESGRLCMWMPVAGSPEDDSESAEDQEYAIPQHPRLKLVSLCQQDFNKWSRRLLTYRKRDDASVDTQAVAEHQARRMMMASAPSGTADDLNNFRKRYFEGFKD